MTLIVGSGGEFPLEGWRIESRKIGRRRYQGSTTVCRVVDVTYQQKSHTHGYISGVAGFSIDGYGLTGGGGGFVSTEHENVATVIVRDGDGFEQQIELPARVAVRPETIVRLDSINGRLIGATNLSGRGGLVMLAQWEDFFPRSRFRKTYLALALLGWWVLNNTGSSPALVVLGIGLLMPIALWALHAVRTTQNRKQMADYMEEVWKRGLR